MRDVLLHTLLGGGLAASLYLLSLVFGGVALPLWLAAVAAGVVLFFRELTQVQARYHRNRFFRGWDASPTGVFNMHHTVEWLVPTLAILTFTLIPVIA